MNEHKLLVKAILEKAPWYPWSWQGFGMLRLYISDELRLHVWDPENATPEVSTIHNHPWDFESEVIVGSIVNYKFEQYLVDPSASSPQPLGRLFRRATILCSPGGGMTTEPELVELMRQAPAVYVSGDVYRQTAAEIHESIPTPGTVTLVRRVFGADKDHAQVFWPAEHKWVSAEPVIATHTHIHVAIRKALKLF
jgi:hypothetical protein